MRVSGGRTRGGADFVKNRGPVSEGRASQGNRRMAGRGFASANEEGGTMTSGRCTWVGSAVVGAAAAVLAGGCGPSDEGPLIGAGHVSVAANLEPAFAVGVAPTTAPPVAVGAPVSFRVSSSEAGYGHLYLINADGGVTMLAENLPLAAATRWSTRARTTGSGFARRRRPASTG